jgi:hypothetical protein
VEILGLTLNEWMFLGLLALGVMLAFWALRFVMRVTQLIWRLGCLTVVLLVGGAFLFFWLT